VEVAQRCRARDLLLRRRRIVHCCPGLEISVGGGDGDRMREEPLLVLPDLQRWWQSRETNYSRMSRAVKRRREEARGRIHCRTASRRRAMGLDRTAAMDGERRKLAARRWSRQRGGRRRVATAGCCVSAADATRRAQDRPGFAPPARDIHSSPCCAAQEFASAQSLASNGALVVVRLHRFLEEMIVLSSSPFSLWVSPNPSPLSEIHESGGGHQDVLLGEETSGSGQEGLAASGIRASSAPTRPLQLTWSSGRVLLPGAQSHPPLFAQRLLHIQASLSGSLFISLFCSSVQRNVVVEKALPLGVTTVSKIWIHENDSWRRVCARFLSIDVVSAL
jgi:hypothetical protein